jgi:hypothetical protein
MGWPIANSLTGHFLEWLTRPVHTADEQQERACDGQMAEIGVLARRNGIDDVHTFFPQTQ